MSDEQGEKTDRSARSGDSDPFALLDQPLDFKVYGPGELQPRSVWEDLFSRRRETIILWLSAGIIVTILLVAAGVIAFSQNSETRSWATQALTALLGFGAGALFSNNRSSGNSE